MDQATSRAGRAFKVNTKGKQSGVALITAILMVSVATVAAVAMAHRQQIDIRRTGNLLHHEQALSYAEGAESWAQVILARDARNSTVDMLEEDWAKQVPVSVVDGGVIRGRLMDLQGRFNLNNLVQGGKPHPESVETFKRLLAVLGLQASLKDAVIDWIDPDDDLLFPDGAEDNEYLGLQPAYRTANRSLVNISELLLIKGFNQEIVSKLQPFVCILPELMAINVNTAPNEVIQSLGVGISQSDAETLIDDRGKQGYADAGAFLGHSAATGKGISPGLIGVQSSWFRLLAVVNIGQAQSSLTGKIQRVQPDDIRVVSREWVLREPLESN